MPHELAFDQVFVPPLLVVSTLAVILAYVTISLLNRWRISRFFAAPPLVFIALLAIYIVIISTFLIRV